jgi:heptosyltransferase-3
MGSIRTVVGVFPGALGDFLLALPALRALRARHAGARLVLVVGEALRPLARLADVADAVESLDAADAAWLFGATRLPAWLAARPACVHAWLGTRDADLRARLAAVADEVRLLAVERGDGVRHAALAYADALGVALAADVAAAAAVVAPPPSNAAEALCAAAPGRLLVVHRGAGGPAKRWPTDGFRAVVAWWRSRGGAVVDLQGPADAGLDPLDDVRVARGWPLPDVAALVARATWCGHDTGPTHLASAVGARGVALFGPTSPARWAPLSARIVPLVGAGGVLDTVALPPERVVAALSRPSKLDKVGGRH